MINLIILNTNNLRNGKEKYYFEKFFKQLNVVRLYNCFFTTLGYGTDDEMMGNEMLDSMKGGLTSGQGIDPNPSLEKNESIVSDSEEEDNIEPEIDDDTQVSSNVLDGKSPRGNIRTRGGLHTSSGEQMRISVIFYFYIFKL